MPFTSKNEFSISIAGIASRLVVNGDERQVCDYIEDRYGKFQAPGEEAAFSVSVEVVEGLPFIPIIPNSIYDIRTAERGGVVQFESYFEKGWIDLRAGQAAVVLRPKGELENFLRVLYAWRCLDQDGLLLHASGVIRHGRGYVFIGHSGSGKTTISRLALEHTVLSDDMVILKLEGEGVRLYGVPFRGDFHEVPRTNASAPLSGLSVLVKDEAHRVELLPSGQGLARLAECAPFVMSQPSAAARVLTLCAQIENRVPLRALHFRRDAGFWSVLDEDEPVSGAASTGRVANR